MSQKSMSILVKFFFNFFTHPTFKTIFTTNNGVVVKHNFARNPSQRVALCGRKKASTNRDLPQVPSIRWPKRSI